MQTVREQPFAIEKKIKKVWKNLNIVENIQESSVAYTDTQIVRLLCGMYMLCMFHF